MPAPTKQLNLLCVDADGATQTFRLPVALATGEEVLLQLQSRRESCSKAMDRGRLQHLRIEGGAFIDLKEPLLDQLMETETDLEAFQQLPPEAKGEQRKTPQDPVFAKVHQRYDPKENQELQAELGQGLLDYGGRNGWRFCKNPVTGETGFVPKWVFEQRPFGVVQRIEATTGKYIENLTFHMRDGSRRFYGTAGGDRFFSEDLAQDEAIVRVTQEIWGDECVRYQVKTTRRELVINSLESGKGCLQKPCRRLTVESKRQRQIRTLKFLDKTLVGSQHQRLYPRYIKRCANRRRYLQRQAQDTTRTCRWQ